MFRKLMVTSATWITLPIRLGLAAVFIAHGSQKVLGAFGGPGFKAFTAGNTPFSFMRPAWLWLGAAALSELVGGFLVVWFLMSDRWFESTSDQSPATYNITFPIN